MKTKTDSELVLEFCIELSRRMIVSGANLERVQLAVEKICSAYGFSDISLFLLSNNISLSVMDQEGAYTSRQCTIPPAGIHLDRLRALNDLSYRVTQKKPSPQMLRQMLLDASKVTDRPDWHILLGQIVALSCLCLIFGGNAQEVFSVAIVVVAMHYFMIAAEKPGLNRLVTNALIMWFATVAAILVMQAGFSTNAPVIMISLGLLVIPGIPLVNSVRNLLCGNEMNGIIQLAKVFIETMALAMGIFLALLMFGMDDGMRNAIVTARSNPVFLVIVSFLASAAFGVVFRIPNRDLWTAGLGGALIRIVLILLSSVVPVRLFYITVAALAAGLYAEAMATKRHFPSTYFIYPAIIPLIPGDLFYFTLVGVYIGDAQIISTNGMDCLLSLLGLSIGFVLSSIVAHYTRKMRFTALLRAVPRGEDPRDAFD
ncbi:MAG: threonine/serine ThrE exporter family protein [bacterium]